VRSRLTPFRKPARTLRRCLDGVLAYFDTNAINLLIGFDELTWRSIA
jgi:transposase